MIETDNVKLEYFKTFGQEYLWFLLYEFDVSNTKIFQMTDKQILRKIMSTRILNNIIYHKEMKDIQLELVGLSESSKRPFNFDRLELDDFNFIKTKFEFEKWIFEVQD